MKTYYLDFNATGPCAPEVFQAMKPYFCEVIGNPSSQHASGQACRRALSEARDKVAAFLNTSNAREIVFTSGGTESNNLAIRAALKGRHGKNVIVTSAAEHSSVLKLCRELSREGIEVREVPLTASGGPDLEQFEKMLTPEVALVSMMWANNETGVIFPVKKISRLCREKDILFHADAVQAVGKSPVNVREVPVDYLSLSAHKFSGPKGVGALYVRSGVPCDALLLGGSQERGRRAGTENVTGIVGLGEALGLAGRYMSEDIVRMRSLRNTFEKGLNEFGRDIDIHGASEERLPNTVLAAFPGIEAETLIMALSQNGVYVSSGSACLSGAGEPSHVLKAMQVDDVTALSSVRFSLGRTTTDQDIAEVLAIVRRVYSELREMSNEKEMVS